MTSKIRFKCLSPRMVITFDRASWSITVPASNGRTRCEAIEDVRPAVPSDIFESLVLEANEELGLNLSIQFFHPSPVSYASSHCKPGLHDRVNHETSPN